MGTHRCRAAERIGRACSIDRGSVTPIADLLAHDRAPRLISWIGRVFGKRARGGRLESLTCSPIGRKLIKP
jgi:hypothetical protein